MLDDLTPKQVKQLKTIIQQGAVDAGSVVGMEAFGYKPPSKTNGTADFSVPCRKRGPYYHISIER